MGSNQTGSNQTAFVSKELIVDTNTSFLRKINLPKINYYVRQLIFGSRSLISFDDK